MCLPGFEGLSIKEERVAMCGIVLIARGTGTVGPGDQEAGRRMLARLARRGPDGSGEWVDPASRVYLGHRRLAVIDPGPEASQPFHWPEAGLSVVFNGEIYNWKDLRRELEGVGHRFMTRSDTEVLIHAYGQWGVEVVHHLRGMYAFAIWDGRNQEVFLARDPYGIKPLYYCFDGEVLQVASQVKALLAGGVVSREPDPAGWVGFLLWGSVPEPYTVYRQIRSLPAGSTLVWNMHGLEAPVTRFDFGEILAEGEEIPDPPDFESEIRIALRDSVQAHLVADVPVGAFLSAGVDSGSLVGLMRDAGYPDIRTVTLGFEEFQRRIEDEVPLAEKTARHHGTRHMTRIVGKREFQDDWPRILEAMDQPSVDGANTWFVSKATREVGLKVALSGVGGDELFGGYPSFHEIPVWVRRMRRLSAIPLARPCGYLLARTGVSLLPALPPKLPALFRYGQAWEGAYFARRGLFMPWELSRLLDHDFAETGLGQLDPLPWQTGAGSGPVLTDLGRVMLLESTWYLRNQLLRDADWASMDHSVELRTPLVDWRLFMTIAPGLAARTVPGKDALIRAPGFPLPASQTGREKTGFGMPLGSWLFEENKGSKDRVRSPGEASRRLAAGLLGAVVRVSASQT